MQWSDLVDPTTIEDPYALYARLRDEAPVWRVPGTPVHVVGTWELVTDVVRRVEDFSSHLDALLYAGPDGEPALFDMSELGQNIRTLATADPPQHTVHRKAVFPLLVERRMAEPRRPP